MGEITFNEFKRRLLTKLIRWPPVIYDGKIHGWSIPSEDRTEEEFVWAILP